MSPIFSPEAADFSFLHLLEPTLLFTTFWRRAAGLPPPWTKDPVLGAYKFTNAYRASDRVIDVQNLFCEVDKYARVAYPQFTSPDGRHRTKQRFRPSVAKCCRCGIRGSGVSTSARVVAICLHNKPPVGYGRAIYGFLHPAPSTDKAWRARYMRK